MKKIVLLFFVFTATVACEKEDETKTLKNKVAGTWEFDRFMGYPDPYTLSPGNGNLIILGANGSYERRQNNLLQFKGTYTLQVNTDACKKERNLVLTTNEYPSGNYYEYIQLEDNQLVLSTPCTYQDGGSAYYRRINNR